MRLVKANVDDNDKLNAYFSQTLLPGPVDFRFERKDNFFSQYQLQSNDYVTYYLENSDGQIEALVSLVFREGYINGEKQTIGYATDLRVSKSRRAILQWAQNFLPALEKERDERNCKYIFSVVANEQREAYNTFIRPRSPKRKMPRYYSFRRFQIVSLHGFFPFYSKPLTGIKVTHATEKDRVALLEYILEKKQNLSFYFNSTVDELDESLARWSINIEDFLVAKDIDKNIIGCTAPWSNQQTQSIYPMNFDPKVKSLNETLDVLSFLGMTKPFTDENQMMNFKFLTHLYSDNPEITFSLQHQAFKELEKEEFLVYTHFDGDLLTKPQKSFIKGSVKCGLYCILGPNEQIPDFLKPSYLNVPPDFETALI